jgi:hypothetical protein
MLALMEARTRALLEEILGTSRSISVVGNGPISEEDRAEIAKSTSVLRFNDMNSRRFGEKTSLRVVRHPSWITFQHTDAPLWHVAPTTQLVPSDAQLFTPVYESQHGHHNLIGAGARIFPSCNCGPSCLQASTWAGPSTGAVALSVLQELPTIERIEVYGFNGNGNADMHIDFANKTLLSGCCTKCTFHPTSSSSYGQNLLATGVGAASIGAVALVAVVSVVGMRRVFRKPSKPPEMRRPLLSLPKLR